MNLSVSYNWLKEYVKTTLSAEDFSRQVSLCGPGVERWYPQAPMFDAMLIGQIVGIAPHPNADKLRLVETNIGERMMTLVCGGSNLSVGMKVVVALVGAKVRWHGQGELITLASAEIRGVKSEGMICGASEIGLADAFPHAEREIMDMSWCKAKPGTALAKALDLDDTVLDVEITTNRPDAFSMIGLAREAAAILEKPFVAKDAVVPSLAKSVKRLPLKVKIASPKLCSRYQTVVMDGVQVGPSPWWLKNRLRMAGVRPINTIVDITNYVMLEYGQPMHAFDYRELRGEAIMVRTAQAGEVLKMLDGTEKKFSGSELLIADAERPLAVAGVMGGEHSGITDTTTTIVFESAAFDPVSVRRTARSLHLLTDASQRFEKGLPFEGTAPALARAIELCQQVTGGHMASEVIDAHSKKAEKKIYRFRPAKASELIGVEIPEKMMVHILGRLGFKVSRGSVGDSSRGQKKSHEYKIEVPYWRARDIENERDFAEEIARIYGYHRLPSVIPAGEIPMTQPDPLLDFEMRSKEFFRGAGCLEMFTYSFMSGVQFERTGFDPATLVKVANPLSTDFEYMRPSLVPSALAVVAQNQGMFPEGKIFELSNIYLKQSKGLPKEKSQLLIAVYGTGDGDALFRQAKGMWEAYASWAKVDNMQYRRMEHYEPFVHPGRSALVYSGERPLGAITEMHPSILRAWGIDHRVVIVEIDMCHLLASRQASSHYVAVPEFPPVRRDVAMVIGDRVEWEQIRSAVVNGSTLLTDVELFDVYRGKGVEPGKKSIAMHLSFAHPERTLTAEQADAEVQSITTFLQQKFGATVRS